MALAHQPAKVTSEEYRRQVVSGTRKTQPKRFLALGTPRRETPAEDWDIGDSPRTRRVDVTMLTPYEKAIVKFCDDLAARLLAKYRKGNRAHGGGLPTKLDCQREVNQEVLDIINYFLIDKVNAGKT